MGALYFKEGINVNSNKGLQTSTGGSRTSKRAYFNNRESLLTSNLFTRFPEARVLDNWGHGGARLVSVILNLIEDSATPHALVTPRGTGRCDPL